MPGVQAVMLDDMPHDFKCFFFEYFLGKRRCFYFKQGTELVVGKIVLFALREHLK